MLEIMLKGAVNLLLFLVFRRLVSFMDIVGLFGYERFFKKERELCVGVRFVFEVYLEFREIFVGECKRNGFFRL